MPASTHIDSGSAKTFFTPFKYGKKLVAAYQQPLTPICAFILCYPPKKKKFKLNTLRSRSKMAV